MSRIYQGEAIIINGDVKVTVLEISGSHVKIGIDAPAEVKVYGEEVHERMQAETDSDKDVALITWNEIIANPEAAQIPTIENLSKAYVDPVTAQIIIEQLAGPET